MTKHKWLTWASELQAIAQNGLTYSKDDFDQHVAYFSLDNLPELSQPRVTDKQIKIMYKHYLQPDLPTEFD